MKKLIKKDIKKKFDFIFWVVVVPMWIWATYTFLKTWKPTIWQMTIQEFSDYCYLMLNIAFLSISILITNYIFYAKR